MSHVHLDMLVEFPSCKLYFIPSLRAFLVKAEGHLHEEEFKRVLDELIHQLASVKSSFLIVDQSELEHVPGMLRGWFTAQFLANPDIVAMLRSVNKIIRIQPGSSFALVMMNVVARVAEVVLGTPFAHVQGLEQAIDELSTLERSEAAA